MSFMCGERWLETGSPFEGNNMSESQVEWLKAENARLAKQVEQLIKDLHRIDAARQAAVNQCAVMAEEVDRLQSDLKRARDALASVAFAAIKKN